MTPPILTVNAVEKHYRGTPALRGVSFDLAAGELFGLLGPNGAGKTTLLSVLAGLTDASTGGVTLFGKPFTSRDAEARRAIGLATQDLAVYPELTARENLLFFGRLYGFSGSDLKRRADEMLALAALTDRANHRVGTFSGGMKRRLNLAVALVHGPRLLILDEPTTGVDPQSRNHIFEQVRRLNAAGLTVIYTSHSMEEVQALCPRLAILDHGRVIACDRSRTCSASCPRPPASRRTRPSRKRYRASLDGGRRPRASSWTPPTGRPCSPRCATGPAWKCQRSTWCPPRWSGCSSS